MWLIQTQDFWMCNRLDILILVRRDQMIFIFLVMLIQTIFLKSLRFFNVPYGLKTVELCSFLCLLIQTKKTLIKWF